MTCNLWMLLPTLAICGIALIIAIRAWQRRPAPGTGPTSLLMIGIFCWGALAALEGTVTSLTAKMACYQLEFLCFATVPLLWLAMVLDYLGYQQRITRARALLISLVPLLGVLLCWTNHWHGLIITHSTLGNAAGVQYLLLDFGPAFWAFAGYMYLILLLGFAACLSTAATSVGIHRCQALLLLVGGFVPAVAALLDMTYSVLPAWNLTPLGFLFTGLTLVWGVAQYRLWRITPVAYVTVFQTVQDGICVVDACHRVIEINPAGAAQLCAPRTHLLGQPVDKLFDSLPGLSREHFSGHDACLVSEDRGKSPRVFDIRITSFSSLSQPHAGWVMVLHEISDVRRLEKQLHHLAYYDSLTGLSNRELFHDRLEQGLRLGRRHHTHTGIIVLDLDHFKLTNDQYGHFCGDRLLTHVATRLQEAIGEGDTVSRFGGDEFMLLFPNLTAHEELLDAARRIHMVFDEHFSVDGHEIRLTPSLGLAIAPLHGTTVEVLLKRADLAMYQAKMAGGDQYAFYPSAQMHALTL